MNDKLSKPYNPSETEDRIYKMWLESGYFTPENCPNTSGETFSMVLPPPNVTGTLHMGHASVLTIEDIMTRYHRMKGDKTLWLPGTDHAAIATQSKVEKEISKKEGLSRHDLGREELLKRVKQFAQESHDTIVGQCKKMGASLDWTREAYTFDDKRNFAVRTAFKKMYDAGLIVQGDRIINWDPKGQTTLSDDEIVYEERTAKLYTFKYSADCPITIATTRPETKVGDTAIAVHPDDERYKKYIGQEYDIIFCGEKLKLKVIADISVDKEFGTGALGVTPAHSKIDWDMAKKNDLPIKQVINELAKMMVDGEKLKGKKVLEAREIVVEWLKENNLLIKEEDTTQNVATSYRTGGIIEPLPKKQWFVSVDKKFTLQNPKITGLKASQEITLKELMFKVVENGQIKILPERFEKIYFNWINNLHDWCISRQIWFGHRIPVWYKEKEIYCGVEAPASDGWTQDEDTLDTWFSSGLWSFSTLGWPEKTQDFADYHPTSVLETAYDILFFWVAKMIMMTGFILEDIPFKTVYLHGLVLDAKGKKMSKSVGNVMDPLEIINKFGTDATRMSLIIGTGPGNDARISEDKIKGYKNFSNKIWNIARFIAERTEEIGLPNEQPALIESDQAKIAELNTLLVDIKSDLDNFRFYLAGEKMYHYVWHTLADKYLEESKLVLSGSDQTAKQSAIWTLNTLFATCLQALHPFMPFITEELWGILRPNREKLIVTPWPEKIHPVE